MLLYKGAVGYLNLRYCTSILDIIQLICVIYYGFVFKHLSLKNSLKTISKTQKLHFYTKTLRDRVFDKDLEENFK